MVENKTKRKRTEGKEKISITAVVSKPLHLTQQQRKSLARELKAAAVTFVDSLDTKEKVPVTCNDEIM